MKSTMPENEIVAHLGNWRGPNETENEIPTSEFEDLTPYENITATWPENERYNIGERNSHTLCENGSLKQAEKETATSEFGDPTRENEKLLHLKTAQRMAMKCHRRNVRINIQLMDDNVGVLFSIRSVASTDWCLWKGQARRWSSIILERSHKDPVDVLQQRSIYSPVGLSHQLVDNTGKAKQGVFFNETNMMKIAQMPSTDRDVNDSMLPLHSQHRHTWKLYQPKNGHYIWCIRPKDTIWCAKGKTINILLWLLLN